MMKSEDRMHTKTRRQYTEDFKRAAVQLVRESARPVAQVARDLGIPENRLYRWRAQHRQAESQGTTRVGQRIEAEELLRLKRELTRVTQERDFLKRAAAFFAKESQ
jgi:transposase